MGTDRRGNYKPGKTHAFKQLRAAFAGQARLASGLIAIEGEHLLEEAVSSSQALKTVFLQRARSTLPACVPGGVEVFLIWRPMSSSAAVETQSPQGVAALPWCRRFIRCDAILLVGTPLILIAVGLQDPGNLGTLIRSAEAFRCDRAC